MALFPARPGREAGSDRAVKCEVDAMTVSVARETTGGTARNPTDWPSPPDPGDLSRRLAARRAELRLSVSQVRRARRGEPPVPGVPGELPRPAGRGHVAAAGGGAVHHAGRAARRRAGGAARPYRPRRAGLGRHFERAQPGRLPPAARARRARPARLQHRLRADGPAGQLPAGRAAPSCCGPAPVR